jgi:uncharacterized protein
VVGEPLRDVLRSPPVDPDRLASERLERQVQRLIELHLLVEEDANEFGEIYRSIRHKNRELNSFSPILAITTGCDLRCVYCYEENIPVDVMSDSTIDEVTGWIGRKVQERRLHSLSPILFGGEPLTAFRQACRLMEKLNVVVRTAGAEVTYTMSTNGVLMDRERTQALVDRDLAYVQISLDGPREVHDARRRFHDGSGSFDTILRNLHEAVDLVNVTIKVNVDRHNVGHLPQLLELLVEQGLREKLVLKIEAIAHTPYSTNVPAHHCARYAYHPHSGDLADMYVDTTRLAGDMGFRVTRDVGHTSPCMFIAQDQVAIDPQGNLYKCLSAIGHPEFIVGNVRAPSYNPVYEQCLDFFEHVHQCDAEGCPYLPQCAGGCAYDAFCLTGDPFARDCKRGFHRVYWRRIFEERYHDAIRRTQHEREVV